MSFSKIQRFFWVCAGTPVSIIEKYPTEHSKYFGIGAAIFFTALFASFSGGYALYFVFSGSPLAELWSILFGLLWGVAIFNLDRYIVSGINKSSKGLKQFYQASPRLVFAVLIAVVIARPLELKIFDKEIREQLRIRYLSEQQSKITKVQQSFKEKYALELGQSAAYQKEYDALSSEVNRLREELKAEVFGASTSTTSGIVGYGPYAKNKELVISSRQLRLDFLAGQLALQQSYMNKQKAAEGMNNQMMLTDAMLDQKVESAGFADRNWALGALTHSANDVARSSANAVYFITLLFIAFECAPLIVKLLSDAGPSDVEIRESEALFVSFLTNRKTSLLLRNHLSRQYHYPGVKIVRWRARSSYSKKRRGR